ncbi:MAG: FAD-dependent oxidoreductase, partial [Gemmatimonadota bacterium]|nr:FAD-dependent oxidoreductase [Gemmatimonadota bacterium]
VEFLRYGSIHRNTYLNAPLCLGEALAARDDSRLFFAGQMTGVEGYTESLATGRLAGLNLARILAGRPPTVPPPTTMLGAIYRYLREADPANFQPMNANWGLVDPLPDTVPAKGRGAPGKDGRRRMLVTRAEQDFGAWLATL